MLWENYITSNKKEFLNKIKAICHEIDIMPEWLMHVIWFESKLNPAAVNPISQATGLIQFMPSTALKLGTTVQELRSKSNVEQLDYVFNYLLPFKGKIKNTLDLYFAVFFPEAIDKSGEYILSTDSLSANLIAQQNPGLDKNNDGLIQKSEVEKILFSGLPENIINLLKKK